MKVSRNIFVLAICLLAALALSVPTAQADELFIGTGIGTTCEQLQTSPCDGVPLVDTTPISSNLFFDPTYTGDWIGKTLLIFGVANTSAPTPNLSTTDPIDDVTYYNPSLAPAAGSVSVPATTMSIKAPGGCVNYYCGELTPGTYTDDSGTHENNVYRYLFPFATAITLDQTFTKWSSAVYANEGDLFPSGSITSFSLYVFLLQNTTDTFNGSGVNLGPGLADGGLIGLDFLVTPPPGSFALAAGCGQQQLPSNTVTCYYSGQGLLMPQPPEIPEPASMILLGTGLLGLGAKLRKKLSKKLL